MNEVTALTQGRRGRDDGDSSHPYVGSPLATSLAGTPTAVAPAGPASRTTAPAPTMARSPTVTPSRTVAPAPSQAPAPTAIPRPWRGWLLTASDRSLTA